MNNTTLSRVSLVVPEDRVLDVMEALLAVQATLRADGIDSKLEIKHRLHERTDDARESTAPVVVAGTRVEVAATGDGVPAPDDVVSKRNKVIYRVINPRVRVGVVPHTVRMFLLERGPATAKQIEETLNMGRKSVESALHKLRTDGSVESVQDAGQEIKQRKFDSLLETRQ